MTPQEIEKLFENAPEGATHYVVDSISPFEKRDGDDWFFWSAKSSKWVKLHGLFGDQRLKEGFDIIQRTSPSWNGEGLPPAGVVCEKCYSSPEEYYQVKIIGHDEDLVVFRWLDGPYAGELSEKRQNLNMHINNPHWSFRPIRTPEQIAAEEREAAILQMLKDAGRPDTAKTRDQAQLLYDAGWRKP